MNEDTSFKKETSKLGIDASTPDGTPVPAVEPSISSARPETGSQPDAALPANLVWPPLPDDLKRLYLDQGLSAMKIAKIYDLKYANPKTAESTILHHLRKHGITRRDPAAHNRKATPTLVDEWVARYERGESLKQIAGDSVDPVTVFNHLHKRGLQLRDKVEAQIEAVTMHRRTPFSGETKDIAYIVGLAVGDLYVQRHGRAIRVRTATTHPGMAKLFRDLFSQHGPVYEYPKAGGLTGYEWYLDCDLDKSFEFLLEKEKHVDAAFRDKELFLSFLAGFFDAEGSVYYHRKRKHGAFELSIANTNESLLKRIFDKLSEMGHASTIERKSQNPEEALLRGIKHSSEWIWSLRIWRYDDVVGLLRALPVRHPEKVEKKRIALKLEYRPSAERRQRIVAEWDLLRMRIKKDVADYIALGKEKIGAKIEPRN